MSDDKKIEELVNAAREREAHDHDDEDVSTPIEDAGSQALSESLKSSFLIIKILVVILVLFFFRTLIFTVPTHETAVVLRFGKPVQQDGSILLEPGAHMALPYPIDEIIRIPREEVQTMESGAGWYLTSSILEAINQEPPAMPSFDPARESYTLTSDTNIIHVKVFLKYRIIDPEAYVFNFASATNVLRNVLDSAIFHASSQYTVDQALRLNILGFQEEIVTRVQTLADSYGLGIAVEPSEIRAIPPRYLQTAFDETQSAAQERSAKISEAEGFASSLLARAEGEAEAIVNAGNTEKLRLVETLKAEADYFAGLRSEYEKNPEYFKNRRLVETIQGVMTNAQEKFIMTERADGQPRELRLLLSREPQRPRSQQQQ